MVPMPDDWFNRVRWSDLVSAILGQLRAGRAALLYLARLIDIHEGVGRKPPNAGGEEAVVPPSVILRVDTRLVERD
jgi:hypothetical protein